MMIKIDENKLNSYLDQAKALFKKGVVSNPVVYSAMGVGFLTLPVVPTLGQCNLSGASFTSPNLDLNGGGNDFSFTAYANQVYLTRLSIAWEVATNGNADVYPFVRDVDGDDLTIITNWSTGVSNAFLVNKNGGAADFGANDSGYIGVRLNGTTLGFIQITLGTGNPRTFSVDVALSGLDGNGGTATGGDCVTLPVELLSFLSTLKENSIQLDWNTAVEINNKGFEVQRSLDGIKYEEIGWVDGHGDTSTPQRYSFLDEDIDPATRYYYRLKQFDFNGQYEFSPVLVVTSLAKGTKIGNPYPSPTSDGHISVPFTSESENEWLVTVFDTYGKQLHTQKQWMGRGASNMNLSLGHLSRGIYFLKLESGTESFYKKVDLQ